MTRSSIELLHIEKRDRREIEGGAVAVIHLLTKCVKTQGVCRSLFVNNTSSDNLLSKINGNLVKT